jgi:uncharacterized membrane protein YfcA
MRPWLIWLGCFYAVWIALNFGAGYWPRTAAHWPIALTMTLGSYVAGSTPMGGGTVAFPVLVLLFNLPASLGRNFALLIQSTGMTSAAIFILCRRTRIETRLLRYAILGSAFGIVLGTLFVVPYLADSLVKLIFSCLWLSFGALTLAKNRELCTFNEVPEIAPHAARNVGLVVGVIGGMTVSLTGVGIEMLTYTVLVLLYRMDLKAAIPTAVITTAATSLMGVALHLMLGDIRAEVFYNWLAATPVVLLGAPIGAFLVSVISRVKTLYFVAVLCVLQFVWMLYQVKPTEAQWVFVVASLLTATFGFVALYRLGKARAASHAA